MTPEILAEYFQSVANALPWWVLYLGAIVGHGYLFIVALNVLYAWPLPHGLLKYTRKVDLLFVLFGGPFIFGFALDLFGVRQLDWQGGVRSYLAAYTVLCWILGFGIAPIIEILYLARRTAPQLVKQTADTVNVAKVLGYAPEGHGKDAKMSRLPFNQCFQ